MLFQVVLTIKMINHDTRRNVEKKCFFHRDTPLEMLFLFLKGKKIKASCGRQEIDESSGDTVGKLSGDIVEIHFGQDEGCQEQKNESMEIVEEKQDPCIAVTIMRHKEPIILCILIFNESDAPLTLNAIRQRYLDIDISSRLNNIYDAKGDVNFDVKGESAWCAYSKEKKRLLVSATLWDDVCFV